LSSALGAWGAQSDRQVVFAPDLVAGKRTRGASGQYGAEQALTQLLAGTGLAWKRVNGQTYALEKAPPPQPVNTSQKPASESDTSSSATAQDVKQLDTVSVTGTRIRGGVTASPTITITAQQIQNEGFTDLGEVIRNIPQNFKGGQNPEVPAGNLGLGLANENVTGGSSLNLRGLGPDASLTLLNGRRLSYGGFSQAVDISMIPVEAVDRIDVVPDGASAVYGSDAVGGVGNVILKRDYEGVMLGTRYGAATDGGLATREYTATAGTAWSNGGVIASYRTMSNEAINAADRDYTRYLPNPTTIYPSNNLRSGLISVHQSLGDAAELRLDALASARKVDSFFYGSNAPRYYNSATDSESTWVSPGIEFYLPNDWSLSIGAAFGKDKDNYKFILNDISTGASTVQTSNCFCNKLRTYEVDAQGPLFTLSGGEARAAIGAGYRFNGFQEIVKIGGFADTKGGESSRFAYAEINLPLINSESPIAGAKRLELTGAARIENYDSFGRIVTPQFGIIYGPTEDFSLKGSWGKSFKTPTLFQMYYLVGTVLYPAVTLGGANYPAGATAMYLQGGNSDLKPERARTWTTSLAFHPAALPNLKAELTGFDINYTDRVVFPFTNVQQGLSNPAYAPFIDYSPTAENQEQILARVTNFYNVTGAAYDPSNVVAILHGQFANVSRQRIKGIDLSGSYQFDFDSGRLTVRGSASWLDSSQQIGIDQEHSAMAGTLFNPAKINSRLGAVLARGNFSTAVFANYTGGARDTVNHQMGGSFVTFDTTLRYTTGQRGDALSGLDIALSVQNLLDRDPPFYTPASRINLAPYDPTNYSAVGRFVNLSISKHW
jgi:outer membrane receptor protein involved in Fe transport